MICPSYLSYNLNMTIFMLRSVNKVNYWKPLICYVIDYINGRFFLHKNTFYTLILLEIWGILYLHVRAFLKGTYVITNDIQGVLPCVNLIIYIFFFYIFNIYFQKIVYFMRSHKMYLFFLFHAKFFVIFSYG